MFDDCAPYSPEGVRVDLGAPGTREVEGICEFIIRWERGIETHDSESGMSTPGRVADEGTMGRAGGLGIPHGTETHKTQDILVIWC